jgi:hypothetical protein
MYIIRSRWRITLVMLLALAVALPLLGVTHIAHADTYVHDTGTDITGWPLTVDLQYPDKDTYQPDDFVITPLVLAFLAGGNNASQLQAAQNLLSEPLSQAFDDAWNVTTDQSGKTQRDNACSAIRQGIVQRVQTGTHGAYFTDDDVCNLSPYVQAALLPITTKNSLTALLAPNGRLFLSYWIPSNEVTFHVTTPDSCSHGTVVCPSDPKILVSFDAEVQLMADLVNDPCLQKLTASVEAHNANISGDNLSAQLGEVWMSFVNLINDRPTALFQGYEGSIDAYALVQSLGLTPIANTCQQLRSQGFTQTTADLGNQTLTLRLIHPTDESPVVAAPIPGLTSPTIGTSQREVKVGGTVGVTGGHFRVSDTNLRVQYWDNHVFAGQLSQGQVEWGPKGGKTGLTSIRRYTGRPRMMRTSLTPRVSCPTPTISSACASAATSSRDRPPILPVRSGATS